MKILISVLSCHTCTTYNLLKEAQCNTWAKETIPETDIVFYYGNPLKQNTGKEWYFNHSEGLMEIGYKTIAMFEHALQTKEFDYLFRPNSSLYVNQHKLVEWLTDKPLTNFASGLNGVGVDKILFLHGSGYILSRDVVELIVKHKDEWNHSLIDDVAIGDLMLKKGIVFDRTFTAMGIQIKENKFSWWQNKECVVTFGVADNFNELPYLKEHFHFRVNNAPDRDKDIKLMKLLNDYLK